MNGLRRRSRRRRERSPRAIARDGTSVRVGSVPATTLVYRMAELLQGLEGRRSAGRTATPRSQRRLHHGDVSAQMSEGRWRQPGDHRPFRERRAGHGERDADVAAKALAAVRAGLEPIVCVGETGEQRKAGHALAVVTGHVRGSVPAALADAAFAVAYEPIWAIGSGLTPSLVEIEEVHAAIRATLREIGGRAATALRSSTAARSSPPTPRRSSTPPKSGARWWAARR